MTKTIKIIVPDIGDFTDVPVIEIPVSTGDTVEKGDTIIVLESDKATLEVPTEIAGKIVTIEVSDGDTVSKGALIATLEANAEPVQPVSTDVAADKVPVSKSERATKEIVVATEVPVPIPAASGKAVHASPSIRRYARILGVNLERVSASGPKGRILREDIEAYVKQALTNEAPQTGSSLAPPTGDLPAWPQIDHEKFGTVERVKLSRIVKISGPALARNAMVIPHVTNFEKADVTELESFRKKINAEAGPDDTKLTMLAFAVKAVVSALQAYPKFNSSLEGDELVIKQYWNIGVAADTPGGLVVPVVKEADRKGLKDIASEMKELAGAARSGKLKGEDMQGATFTISSLGGIGGTNFTPIINAPEVAILGMPRSEMQPVWDGAEFQPRLIQPLGLSFDHRVIDGVASAHFLAHIAQILGDFRRLTL